MRRVWTVAIAATVATATVVLAGCTDTAEPGPTRKPPPGRVELDPRADVWRIEVRTPAGLANAGGLVWVASTDGDEVRGVNPQLGMFTKGFDVGRGPARLVSHGHVLAVSHTGEGTVGLYDTGSGSSVGGYKVGGGPGGLASSLDHLVAVRQDAAVVTQVRHGRSELRDIPVDGTPRLIAMSHEHAFVTSYTGGTLTRIRLEGDLEGDDVAVSGKLCEGAQRVETLGEVAWVTCAAGNEVIAVDQKTLKVLGRVAVAGRPDGITVSGDRVFVAALDGPTLYQISADAAAPRILMSRPLGDGIAPADRAGTDVSVYGSRVWISSYHDNAVFGLLLTP